MNAGELREQIVIMKLVRGGDRYYWKPSRRTWAKVEQQGSRIVYAQHGTSAEAVKITMRACDITRHDALMWGGRHCTIVSIDERVRGYYEISAALVEPKECSVSRTVTEYNELNRPVVSRVAALAFPAILTEKYVRFEQREPMSVLDMCYVLAAPKAVVLEKGEVVAIDSTTYVMKVPHTLDEYMNEYELVREEE